MTSTESQTTERTVSSFTAICGRVFHADPEFFPQVEYRGEIIYLCTDACLSAFLADPDHFVAAHKKSYKKIDE